MCENSLTIVARSALSIDSLSISGLRYHNAMSHDADSPEYQNFENLLRRIVTVPHTEIKRRLDDDKATKDWTRANAQPEHRRRPIVFPPAPSRAPVPAVVSSSRTRP
jgi:hypothetical protein